MLLISDPLVGNLFTRDEKQCYAFGRVINFKRVVISLIVSAPTTEPAKTDRSFPNTLHFH